MDSSYLLSPANIFPVSQNHVRDKQEFRLYSKEVLRIVEVV